MDNTMLTTEQMEVAKKLIEFTQNFSDQVVHIMKNHGLWQKGFELKLRIDPLAECLTEEIQFHRWVEDGEGQFKECVDRVKSQNEMFGKGWYNLPTHTSREFIHLFDEPTDGTGKEKGKTDEKPLPPDGMWVGSDRNSDPVDGWEWDINDSLS